MIRLTLFYTLTTSILLIFTTLSFYWVMVNILYQSEHQLLSDEIQILEKVVVKNQYDLSALKQKIKEIPWILDSSVYDYYIRIINNQNKLVTETEDMSKNLQGSHFFNNDIKSDRKQSIWWKAPDGTDYLLMQSTLALNNKINHPWVIQIALDVTFQRNIIKKYRNKLMMGLFIGILCAFFLGNIVARRSLRRLHDLTETTKTITATSLHQRIDPSSWPKELSTLGMSFNQMLDRIETSFLRLMQFSGDLAHELRTPINNLIGETEVTLYQSCSIEEYKKTLESNIEEAHRISQIVENLLFLARVENPKLNMKKNHIHIHEEIMLVQDFYQALIDEKNIKIICTGKADIDAEPNMFRRMLSNILSNALKYTLSKGVIAFEIEDLSHHVQLKISDNGVGIASEHITKIFDRFYRVDSARSQLLGGTGLGLAIVKSIIDLHQGTITATSILGKGMIFTILFPK